MEFLSGGGREAQELGAGSGGGDAQGLTGSRGPSAAPRSPAPPRAAPGGARGRGRRRGRAQRARRRARAGAAWGGDELALRRGPRAPGFLLPARRLIPGRAGRGTEAAGGGAEASGRGGPPALPGRWDPRALRPQAREARAELRRQRRGRARGPRRAPAPRRVSSGTGGVWVS